MGFLFPPSKNMKGEKRKKPKEQQKDPLNDNLTGINYMQRVIIGYCVCLKRLLVILLNSDSV